MLQINCKPYRNCGHLNAGTTKHYHSGLLNTKNMTKVKVKSFMFAITCSMDSSKELMKNSEDIL